MSRAKASEILESAIPIVIACFPLVWLAPIHRHFHHDVCDWDNNLWMIGYTGEFFRRHLSFPMTYNTNQWVGMANPLFYGSLFYPLAGLLSSFVGSALALRLIVVVLFWLQTTQVARTVKLIYQDSYTAWAIAAVVAFAIYPLTNLYSRGAVPEFVAVSLLTTSCCLWLRASIEGPHAKSWSSASWACLLLALSAGTHAITALLGGILFGILVISGIMGTADRIRRAKFLSLYALMYLAALSPWLYAVMKFSARLSVSRVSTVRTFVFGDSIDLWWVRLLPIPFDIRPLRFYLLSQVSTPYMDAQINFGLLLIAGYLVFELSRRLRAGHLENGRVLAPALCLGAFFGTFYLSVSTQVWRFIPPTLSIIQFAYRLVSYCDLLLFILVILLLSILNKYRLEFEGTFRICLAATVVLMAQSVLVKFNHAAFIQEDKDVAGTTPFGDRRALTSLPATFYSPVAYVIQDGYAGNAPPLSLASFLPATGSRFGEVSNVLLNKARSFETNIQAFPWNRLMINGKVLPAAETYLSPDNTLAFEDVGQGPANEVGYAFVPDRSYLMWRYVSAAVLAVWIGALVGTACWRRRFKFLSSNTIFSVLVLFLIVAVGNALPLLAPSSPAPPQLAVHELGNPMASPGARIPAVSIKMQVVFIPAGRTILEAQAAGKSLEEPLVVTGQAGAADMVGVRYDEDGSLRIQVDHWGAPPVTSEPMMIMPGQSYWVKADLGPHGVSVSMDGKVVMRSEVPAYPTTPQQITVAQNNFGGTAKAARFSGKVIKSFIELK